MRNLTVNGERLWASLMELAQIGATAEGRGVPARRERSRRRGAAALHPLVRGGRLHRHGRPDRQHLRAPARPQPGAAAGHDRQPSRHPADRRQVRRRLRRDGRARGGAHASTISATRPRRRSRSSPGPTRRARASRRRWSARACSPACSSSTTAWRRRDNMHRRDARRRTRAHRLCRPGAGRRPPGRRLFRGAYRAGADPRSRRASRSASSPARRASAGTRSPSPARRRMPGRRRCRGGATRWSARRG